MAIQTSELQVIQSLKIRDLVEQYPATMPVLHEHGFDLCCGGEHTVVEAAKLHGQDPGELLKQVNDAIAASQR